MNRRILINEDERSRILGLHENRKQQEWGMLFEAGPYEDQSLALGAETTTSTPTTGGGATTGGGSQTQTSGQATLNYQTAKFPDVKACIAETNQPAALVAKFGLNWRETSKKWIDSKCNGTTPCTPGNGTTNVNLGKALCEGTFGTASSAAPAAQTAGSASGTTFYIDNKPTVLNTDQEISDMVKSKKITADTFVFKSPEIPKPTKISALPEDSPIKKAVMAIIATVPPDLPGETKTFKISPDGKQPAKDYTEEQLTAAIKDGSLTQNAFVVVTDQATGKSSYQSIMQNPEASKIVNLASGPGQVADQFKTTKIPELDAWLKGPLGSVWDKMEEGPLKEKSLDTYTKSDPQLKTIADKIGIGKLRDALGTQRSTMLGRGLANLRKRGVEALGGTVQKTR